MDNDMNEINIKKIIPTILRQNGGSATVTDLIGLIQFNVNLGPNDLIESTTRPGEIKFEQKVRNVVCHQKHLIQEYPDGFILDKTNKPAVFKLKDTLDNTLVNDNGFLNNKNIKQLIEKIIFIYESFYVVEYNPTKSNYLKWISRINPNFKSYSIESVTKYGKRIYIITKATTENKMQNSFYLSPEEFDFWKKSYNNKNVFIYLLCNYKENMETTNSWVQNNLLKLSVDDINKLYTIENNNNFISFRRK